MKRTPVKMVGGSSHLPVSRFMTRENGATLIISLFLLIALLLLGVSTAKMALQGEKISRGDRDREIAFQAAEAALIDAELDIQGSPDDVNSRSHLFASHETQGFPGEREAPCQAGDGNPFLGLCRPASASEALTCSPS